MQEQELLSTRPHLPTSAMTLWHSITHSLLKLPLPPDQFSWERQARGDARKRDGREEARYCYHFAIVETKGRAKHSYQSPSKRGQSTVSSFIKLQTSYDQECNKKTQTVRSTRSRSEWFGSRNPWGPTFEVLGGGNPALPPCCLVKPCPKKWLNLKVSSE